MSQALPTRPWIIGSVALVGAAVLSTAPPPTAAAAHPALPEVALTAGTQLDLHDWSALLSHTKADLTGLADHVSPAPAPALQQLLVNQVEHAQQLFSDPTAVFDEISANVKAALQAPVTAFEPADNAGGSLYASVDSTPSLGHTVNKFLWFPATSNDFAGPSHVDLFTALTKVAGLISADPTSTAILPDLGKVAGGLMQFTGSPLSGVLWGGMAPELSALLQTVTDLQALGHDLQAISTDPVQVGDDLLNAPANITDAFLNGYGPIGIDVLGRQGLVDLVGAIAGPGTGTFVGDLLSVDLGASVTFGGLLSPGGSMFDALGIDGTGGLNYIIGSTATTIVLPGDAVGPIGSLIELGQALATSIGWDPGVDAMPLDALDLPAL